MSHIKPLILCLNKKIQFVFLPNTAIKTASIINVTSAIISSVHGCPNYVCLIQHFFMHNIVNVNVQFRRKIECIRQRIFWYYHGTTRSLHCAAVRAASVIKQGPRVEGRGIDRTVSSDLLLKVEGCIASPMRQGSRERGQSSAGHHHKSKITPRYKMSF